MSDNQEKVLVVDDDEINVMTLEAQLEQTYAVITALDGRDALAKVTAHEPDLMLLDLHMPGMDGFEVLTELRKRGETLPVIFVTGEENDDAQTRGFKLGAADYIQKGESPEIVLTRIRNQLEIARYRDQLESMVDERTKAVRETLNAVVVGMALLAECRDPHTGAHINRVRSYCEIICEKMLKLQIYPEVSEVEYALISDLSPVHDIGKVGVDDSILLKPGRLTPEEFKEMEKHTVYGEETLLKTRAFLNSGDVSLMNEISKLKEAAENSRSVEALRKSEEWLNYRNSFLRVATEIAVGHHERWNGTGYPYKLAGEQIPLSARIVSLADIYDALTSVRPYKKSFSHQETMDILLKGDGRTMPEHFDPKILAVIAATADELETEMRRLQADETPAGHSA
ncbi:two-component system response regulator [Planctomycetales bacterium]|nr:two-component system response regulator [Planctomycetales bacterium]